MSAITILFVSFPRFGCRSCVQVRSLFLTMLRYYFLQVILVGCPPIDKGGVGSPNLDLPPEWYDRKVRKLSPHHRSKRHHSPWSTPTQVRIGSRNSGTGETRTWVAPCYHSHPSVLLPVHVMTRKRATNNSPTEDVTLWKPPVNVPRVHKTIVFG